MDYLKTQPLPSFKPLNEYFNTINPPVVEKNECNYPNSKNSLRKIKKKKKKFNEAEKPTVSRFIAKSSLPSILRSLEEYIRFYCELIDHRFHIWDVEELFRRPVIINWNRPEEAAWKDLMISLEYMFTKGKIKPVRWFNLLTEEREEKGKILDLEEFCNGIQYLSDEINVPRWRTTDLHVLFQYFVGNKTEQIVTKFDLLLAFKKFHLSKRKIKALNHNAKVIQKLQTFNSSRGIEFRELCFTKNMHPNKMHFSVEELETMISILVKDFSHFYHGKLTEKGPKTAIIPLNIIDDNKSEGSSVISDFSDDQGSISSIPGIRGHELNLFDNFYLEEEEDDYGEPRIITNIQGFTNKKIQKFPKLPTKVVQTLPAFHEIRRDTLKQLKSIRSPFVDTHRNTTFKPLRTRSPTRKSFIGDTKIKRKSSLASVKNCSERSCGPGGNKLPSELTKHVSFHSNDSYSSFKEDYELTPFSRDGVEDPNFLRGYPMGADDRSSASNRNPYGTEEDIQENSPQARHRQGMVDMNTKELQKHCKRLGYFNSIIERFDNRIVLAKKRLGEC